MAKPWTRVPLARKHEASAQAVEASISEGSTIEQANSLQGKLLDRASVGEEARMLAATLASAIAHAAEASIPEDSNIEQARSLQGKLLDQPIPDDSAIEQTKSLLGKLLDQVLIWALSNSDHKIGTTLCSAARPWALCVLLINRCKTLLAQQRTS